MSDSPDNAIIAIDGGGTRCRVAFGTDGKTLSVETGSANVSTDFDGAVGALVQGLAGLSGRTGLDVETLATLPAFVGLAGVTGPEIRDRLRKALPFSTVRIEDDRPAALRGALGRRDGIIAHCGTGSFFAAQLDGTMRFSGGWGPVLGDEASAQWVGRAALRLTLESVDGRRAPTALSKRILSEFGDAAGIVQFAGSAAPPQFGALAPLVTEHAEQGDALGDDVMKSGAGEIVPALADLGWTTGTTVCLTGGIGPYYLRYLPGDMQDCVSEPEGVPLDGALSLARDLARGAG